MRCACAASERETTSAPVPLPRAALEEGRSRLVANISRLRASQTFDDLFVLVDDFIASIRGIGELAVYDTALRIGARFNLAPQRVYLHAGTRDGARALGLASGTEAIETHQLPESLQALSPREVEDLLCIYKSRLASRQGPCDKKAPKMLSRSVGGQISRLVPGGACGDHGRVHARFRR